LSRIAVALVVLVLVAGTAAAFTVSEKLKLERSPVTAPRFARQFSPVCDCATDVARLMLRFRRAETVDAVVVDAQGEPIRVLAERERVGKGDHTFTWDGRGVGGEIVPDGTYRLRLRLRNGGRTILVPTTIRVDTKAPKVVLVRVRPKAFSPGGGGRKGHVKVVYRSSERGRPELLVDGHPAVTGRIRGKGSASLNWGGKVGGETVEVGSYELSVRVSDLAGNVSRPDPGGARDLAVVRVERAGA
jgi:hypothetical protein